MGILVDNSNSSLYPEQTEGHPESVFKLGEDLIGELASAIFTCRDCRSQEAATQHGNPKKEQQVYLETLALGTSTPSSAATEISSDAIEVEHAANAADEGDVPASLHQARISP